MIGKLEGQDSVLRKYGLGEHDPRFRYEVERIDSESLNVVRKKLLPIEGRYTDRYFEQVFLLFPKELRPKARRTYHAYDAINNLFNLGYDQLFWRCYRALSKAHLETHLGFLHAVKYHRPSLVCDFEELYRYLIDDFLIGYSQDLKPKDFRAKTETYHGKKGKRIYLKESKNREMTRKLNDFFRTKVSIPRKRHGDRQEIRSLINEEACLLAKCLRSRKEGSWTPRIVELGNENV